MTKLSFEFDDGGRASGGYKGNAGDCVARAIAIASDRPYKEIYGRIAQIEGSTRKSKRKPTGRSASAGRGVFTNRKAFKDFMVEYGFEWVSTMGIGTGCTVHLVNEELPMGRLVVSISKHYTAVIDGVIRDTHDPRRHSVEIGMKDGEPYKKEWDRCVYGYWKMRDDVELNLLLDKADQKFNSQ